MRLISNNTTYYLDSFISEFWLQDLFILEKVEASAYIECAGIEDFTDIINYWRSDKSINQKNRTLVLDYLNTISEIKNSILSEFCSPELLYYEFGAISLDQTSVDIKSLTELDGGYKIQLENKVVFETDKDEVDVINEKLKDIWFEEDKEYLDDSITLFENYTYMFLTKAQEVNSLKFIKNVLSQISNILISG